MEQDFKRNPDAILEKIKQQTRGKLTVFIGAAAGVGKTYAMLEAAHERIAEGIVFAAGWVETHGRKETETLLNGLPVIEPRILDYRDRVFEEMDLDAILERHPDTVLVDELAHTNIPGSRHPRRYLDVEEILNHGINVYTTLNIQHIESLNDVVAQITGVRVRETVPDQFMEKADQIKLVDITAEELIRRLQEGKVYVPEMATQALQKFFRPGNINALRELTLRLTAHRIDRQMEDYRHLHGIDKVWPAGDKVLACISSSPFGIHVLRGARRMADTLKADFIAVYVETPRYLPKDQKTKESLARNLQLAENLGAQIVTVSGTDVAEEILELARKRNINQIVLGKPLHSRWAERVRGSVVEDIIRSSPGMSVHVIPGEKEPEEHAITTRTLNQRINIRSYFWITIQIIIITLIGYIGKDTLGLPNIGMLYLLPVLLASARIGLGPSVAAAVLGVLAYDLFLVPPVLFLSVADARYLITFAVFILVAITTGTTADRLRYRIQESRIRETRTGALYDLAKEIAAVTDIEQLASKVVDHAARTLDAEAVTLLIPEADDVLKVLASSDPQNPIVLDSNETAVAGWSYKNSLPAGNGTDTLPGAYGVYLPLNTEIDTLGVIGIRPREKYMTHEQKSILDAICGLTALAIGRLRLANEAQEVKNLEASERLRTALFNSISHDLRTPLASIIGAVTSLVDEGELYSQKDKATLLASIKQGALRMNRVVGNLLDMARLESGLMGLKSDWYDIQDMIGIALRQAGDMIEDRKVTVDISPNLPMVKADCALIEQVLANLLDNAVKYSPSGSDIDVSAIIEGSNINVAISDQGIGIPPGDEEKVFDKFYRLNSMQNVSGTGLGLSICKGIIEAHGGRIWMHNKSPGGCITTFSLPVGEPIPSKIIINKAGEDGAAIRS